MNIQAFVASRHIGHATSTAAQTSGRPLDSVQLGTDTSLPPRPPLAWTASSPGAKTLSTGADYHRQQAYQVFDALLQAKDPVTGLLPLHFETRDGQVVATDHMAAGLDMGRQTAGLVMASQLAEAQGDKQRAERYLRAAEENYAAGKRLLSEGDRFVQRRDFNEDGSVKSTERGEPNKSAPGEDNMSRINPRGYAFRGAAELYRATGKEEYRQDFDRYFQAWVRDFHDEENGGLFLHSNLDRPGDHQERGNFQAPAGQPSSYDGVAGAKGNDGTIYALSGVLLAANEVFATPQTQTLVREQMDLILNRLQRQNGMLWENYQADFTPVSLDWQSQPRESGQPSHVAIGGHTAMAGQQVIEGARQLRQQGVINQAQYDGYVQRAVDLFQDFASQSGAVDWNSGAVHNAIRVEEPDASKRWLSNWGDASWQQAEFLQTMVRLHEEGRLGQIQGPDGQNGTDLFAKAQSFYQEHYSQSATPSFSDYFGNPNVYHVPQVALYFQQAQAK